MKIVHHHANGNFDWLISEHRRVNPSREAISILSGKYKRFMFVHPVATRLQVKMLDIATHKSYCECFKLPLFHFAAMGKEKQ